MTLSCAILYMEVHMRKIKLITIAAGIAAFIFATSVQETGIAYTPSVKEDITDESAVKENTAVESAITDTLRDYMAKAAQDEKIPVTIELTDSIDLEKVEQRALARANLSAEEKSIMNVDTSLFSEVANEAHQKLVSDISDEISAERNGLLKEHYRDKITEFISSAGISENDYGSVGVFTPFIRDVMLTQAQIQELADDPNVLYIDYVGDSKLVDFASVDDTYRIINGNVSVDDGYTGSGIRVGVVESGHPKLGVMGNDFKSIIKTNSGGDSDHATIVCGIIRKMAPACILYTRSVSKTSEAIEACTYLIDKYNVSVINVSCGEASAGSYNSYTREIDKLIQNTKVTIVAAAGNGDTANQYVNQIGLAANSIAVGSVISAGKNAGATGAYMRDSFSLYREGAESVNKPDICAPGKVSIYTYQDQLGTSFAAPHVTGAVVQMMARNSGLKDKPEALKAAIMASASYNAGTSMSYVKGTRASNQEGAGVLDAGFCYRAAKNSKAVQFSATSTSSSFTYNVYCSYVSLPFRIACVWDVLSTDTATNITDYDVKVYKNGTLVASSNAYANSSSNPRANYEIIEIPEETLRTYGAGTYQVVISRSGSFKGTGTVRIGLSWEQR